MSIEIVYLGLGSNLGHSFSQIKKAFIALSNLPCVKLIKTSRLYQTSPVSTIAQNDYINAVCKLQTSLSAEEFFVQLRKIENSLGKRPKLKTEPREIDIDILFFGTQRHETPILQIPHPRWNERLFVLMPLWDLTDEITYPSDNQNTMKTLQLKELIHSFPNLHNERVLPFLGLNKTGK